MLWKALHENHDKSVILSDNILVIWCVYRIHMSDIWGCYDAYIIV